MMNFVGLLDESDCFEFYFTMCICLFAGDVLCELVGKRFEATLLVASGCMWG